MRTVFVSTPCYAGSCTEVYAACLLRLQHLCAQNGIQLMLHTTENESLIPRARNLSVARFLYLSPADFLMFIDADIEFDPRAVLRLLDSGHDVAVGCYPKRTLLWDQAAARILPGDKRDPSRLSSTMVVNYVSQSTPIVNGFVEVLDGGTGFMMIRRSVIERMYDHYRELDCINDQVNQDLDRYCAIFDCMIDPDSRRFLSEDYAFCRRWQLLGGKIHADVASTFGHIGTMAFRGCLEDRLRAVPSGSPDAL